MLFSPKMQVYTEFDYDKVIELINTYSHKVWVKTKE